MKPRVALLFGGEGKEREVSVMGYEYLSELLSETDLEIIPVHIDASGAWSLSVRGGRSETFLTPKLGGSLYTGYGHIKIDAAIPLLHGERGEDGSIQGSLACCGVKYVGADTVTSALCIDKSYTKAIARRIGVPTLDDVSFDRPTDSKSALKTCAERLGFPMFIKPRRRGSSIGASPARSEDDFLASFDKAALEGDGLVIVEPLIEKKREIECAFVEIEGRRTVTPPGEVHAASFYSYGEKYGARVKTSPRADLPAELSERIVAYASKIADAVGLRHLGRIDFFLRGEDIFFNEVNTFPGFTRESLYPIMLAYNGFDVARTFEGFIANALGW